MVIYQNSYTEDLFQLLSINKQNCGIFGLAQIPKLKIKIPKRIPGLDKILKREPALTTSISDAVTGVPFLDDYNPKITSSLSLEPRNSEGSYVFPIHSRLSVMR